MIHEDLNNNDHSSLVTDIQTQIYSKMSWAKKWEKVQQLREIAWALNTAGVRSRHPEWSDQEVQAEVKKIFLYATT